MAAASAVMQDVAAPDGGALILASEQAIHVPGAPTIRLPGWAAARRRSRPFMSARSLVTQVTQLTHFP
jgi:hypothetical protein